jgi:predicted PurR-regulated permease PerM
MVPKEAKLNSALTILSVFAGIGIFGFIGIIIGPVVMIIIVTTIQVYLKSEQDELPKEVEATT